MLCPMSYAIHTLYIYAHQTLYQIQCLTTYEWVGFLQVKGYTYMVQYGRGVQSWCSYLPASDNKCTQAFHSSSLIPLCVFQFLEDRLPLTSASKHVAGFTLDHFSTPLFIEEILCLLPPTSFISQSLWQVSCKLVNYLKIFFPAMSLWKIPSFLKLHL